MPKTNESSLAELLEPRRDYEAPVLAELGSIGGLTSYQVSVRVN